MNHNLKVWYKNLNFLNPSIRRVHDIQFIASVLWVTYNLITAHHSSRSLRILKSLIYFTLLLTTTTFTIIILLFHSGALYDLHCLFVSLVLELIGILEFHVLGFNLIVYFIKRLVIIVLFLDDVRVKSELTRCIPSWMVYLCSILFLILLRFKEYIIPIKHLRFS